MSEFIKTQEEIRANLTMQIREVIEGAESESRGIDSAEVAKIDVLRLTFARLTRHLLLPSARLTV